MKNALVIMVFSVLACSLYGKDVQSEYKKYANARRYCVSRDTKTLDGYVITTWYRNGKPDWILPAVETNRLHSIVGVEQNNPIQNELVRVSGELAKTWVAYTNQIAQTVAYSNAYVIAERVASSATAKIQDEINDLRQKIEKYKEYQTKYPILKSIFAAMIADAENRIKILEALTTT